MFTMANVGNIFIQFTLKSCISPSRFFPQTSSAESRGSQRTKQNMCLKMCISTFCASQKKNKGVFLHGNVDVGSSSPDLGSR